MKVAIVHDYLNQLGGAERVVGSLHRLFPHAPIYTSISDPACHWPSLQGADIRTSWMQRLPGLKKHFKKYLPLYPHAIESFDLSAYDVVISSSSAFGKGAITRKDALHLCYCHTPMRFVWDYDRYVEREQFGRLLRWALPPMIERLKRWDLATAHRPGHYVANSTVVARRIKEVYGASAEVIFPPVDVARYQPDAVDDEAYVAVARLAPYKRIDLLVETFNASGRPLVVIGDGPARQHLESLARPNVRFLGRLPDEEVARYYARCRGLLLPGEEDFGITPLEANAAGRPAIALRAGGALDTVVDGETGVFFETQTVAALEAAIRRCDAITWDKARLRHHAEQFSEEAFLEKLGALIARLTEIPRL